MSYQFQWLKKKHLVGFGSKEHKPGDGGYAEVRSRQASKQTPPALLASAKIARMSYSLSELSGCKGILCEKKERNALR